MKHYLKGVDHHLAELHERRREQVAEVAQAVEDASDVGEPALAPPVAGEAPTGAGNEQSEPST